MQRMHWLAIVAVLVSAGHARPGERIEISHGKFTLRVN
jgi:hypothetical protein